MNELSRRYVSAFNRIEEQLNIACRTNIYTPFYKLIDGAVKSNTIIRNFEACFANSPIFETSSYTRRWSLQFLATKPS